MIMGAELGGQIKITCERQCEEQNQTGVMSSADSGLGINFRARG